MKCVPGGPRPRGCIALHKQEPPQKGPSPPASPRMPSSPIPAVPPSLAQAQKDMPIITRLRMATPQPPHLPLSAHYWAAGQLIKSSFIFHSICRVQQGAPALFGCTIFKPFIIIIIIAACFFSFPAWAAPQAPVPRAQDGMGWGGGACYGGSSRLRRSSILSRVLGQQMSRVPSPGPHTWHRAASAPAGSGAQSGSSRGARNSLPTAALLSMAGSGSAPAFAEATAGKAAALAGCSAALHPI